MSDSAKNIMLALFIFLLPPMAIFYLIFSKSKLWDNPWVKTISLSWCLVFILFAFFTPHQRQSTDNKQSIGSSQAKTESESNTKTEIINDAENTDGNNVKPPAPTTLQQPLRRQRQQQNRHQNPQHQKPPQPQRLPLHLRQRQFPKLAKKTQTSH